MTVEAAAPEKNSAARDTLMLLAGMAAAQGILWAVLPLWSRLYGPSEFAKLGVWSAVVAIVSTLLLLRYDTCIVIARDDTEARALLRLCLQLAAGGGMLLALVCLLLPGVWRTALGLQPLEGWLPLAVLSGALAAMGAALLAYANRNRRYGRMTLSRVMLAGVAALVGSVLGGSVGGLLWAQLAGAVAALPLLLAGAGAAAAPDPDNPDLSRPAPDATLLEVAQRHSAAPRYLWPAALLDALTQQLPMLLTVIWFTAAEAGQFSLAWRVTALPVLMLASAAGTVFYPRFAAAAADPVAARALLLRHWRSFGLAALLPALLLLAFGGPLFALLFGAPWREAGTLAAVLAPMLWAMLVSSSTSTALIVLGLQKWSPLFGLAMLVYRPAALALGAAQGSLVLGLGVWAGAEMVAIVLYNRLLLRRLRPI